MVERGESLTSNLALSAGSDLDGLHDALSTEGGVYIQMHPWGSLFVGITLSSNCGSVVGGELAG